MRNSIKQIFTFLSLCLYGLLWSAESYAQQPVVSVQMDSTYVIFGSPMTFHLQAIVPEDQPILFPQQVLQQGGIEAFDDSARYLLELDDFEAPHVDTVQNTNGMLTLQQDLIVYAFDSATLYIPPFEFVTSLGDTLRTNSLALKVFVPFEEVEVDPSKFCDLKDVQDPEFVLMDYIWWFIIPLVVLALLAAGWFGWRYWQQHKKDAPVVLPAEKSVPAHIQAMQALDELDAKKLWQNGRDKQFHTELTDILRFYIERRFDVQAMEKTTDEILDELYELSESQKASLNNLRQILQLADLVKFAKYKPLPDENQLSFMNSRMFVEQTKKVEIEEPQNNESVKE